MVVQQLYELVSRGVVPTIKLSCHAPDHGGATHRTVGGVARTGLFRCHIMHQITVVQRAAVPPRQGADAGGVLSYHAPDHGGATC